MKTAAELKEIAQFIAEYATRLMGSGVHTSRVVRNSKRLGEALGVRVIVSAFQRVVTFSVCNDESGEIYSEVADIPPLPISFELNAELSALSWEAFDRRLPLAEIRARYADIIARPRLDPIFTLILVGFANASFCRLFGGDWFAVKGNRAAWIRDTFHPVLTEMEGGAIAQVCLRNGTRFVALKSVSDHLFSERQAEEYFDFGEALEALGRVVLPFAQRLAEEG